MPNTTEPQDPGYRRDPDLDGSDVQDDADAAYDDAVTKAAQAYMAALAALAESTAEYAKANDADHRGFSDALDALHQSTAEVADTATDLLDLLGYRWAPEQPDHET